MMMLASRWVLVFFSAILLVSSTAALAKDDTDTRQAKERAAKKACIIGDVSKGIDILGDLFVEHNDIIYVFNQARCYQQNHQWERALDRFAEYQRKAGALPADQRTELELYIADCKAHLSAGQTPSVPMQVPLAPGLPPQQSAVPESRAVQTNPVAGVATSATPAPVAHDGRNGQGRRVAGLVLGGVGVAAVATGIVMAAKTHSLTDDIHKNGYDAGKISSRDSYEAWGWVGYGVGVAGIVGGTALYLWGRSAAAAPSAQLSLLPVLGPGGAGLVVEGGL
jgi:hypothetical protein